MTTASERPGSRPSADEAGFRQWVAARAPGLRRKAYLLCGDWDAADDLVQEALIAVYKSWPRVARGSNVDAYANRVLVHKFIDDTRRPWRRVSVRADVPERDDPSAARDLERIEGQDAPLNKALANLPAQQRAVLVLRYTDDLTVDEIARAMDLPSGTVKSRLSRGVEALRAQLDEAHSDPLGHDDGGKAMSVDLQRLFDQTGHDRPAQSLDIDYIIGRGRRARTRRLTLVAGAIVAVCAVTIAGGALLRNRDVAPPPSTAPAAIAIPTSSWKPGDPAMLARVEGLLTATGDGCLYLKTAHGEIAAGGLVWPAGYSARLVDDVIEVTRPDGAVVARTGQQLVVGGGFGRTAGCAGLGPDPDGAFAVNVDLAPLP